MLVHQFLEDSAQRRPDAAAVLHGDETLTYGALDRQASAWAAALAEAGVRPGDRVGLLAQNSTFYVAAYYGILKSGGVAVALDAAAEADGVVACLVDCGASVLVAGPRFERVLAGVADRLLRLLVLAEAGEGTLAAAAPIGPDARAAIIYTSGSTGRPRGVVLRHANIVENTRSIVAYLDLRPEDRVLAVLPFHYVYGKSLLNTHVAVGGSVIVENRFGFPQVALDTLEREQATGFAGVPSHFAILLNRTNLAERPLPSLRYVTQAGGPMAPELTRRLIAALPGKRIFVMYGATEAAARLTYVPPEDLPRKIGSVGRAIPGVTIAIVGEGGGHVPTGEVGEVVARGPNIMEGYWNDPAETAAVLDEHGYHTGDLGRLDEDGFLWLAGRAREQIKSGAHRIHPREIEDVIAEHPAVHESAVVGRPDETLGEAILAFVVLREATSADAESILAHCRARLPAYKLPKAIAFRRELPRGPTGKIDKRALH